MNLVKMLCLLLLTLPLLGNSVPMSKDEYKAQIIGGDIAHEGEFPWQVGLRLSYYRSIHICGGSLIHPSWILTAAHCFSKYGQNPRRYNIQLRQQNLYEHDNLLSVKEIIIHHRYKYLRARSDLALVKLHSSVQLTGNIKPLRLPEASQNFTRDMECWLSGWGYSAKGVPLPSPYTLRKVQVTVMDARTCDQEYHWNSTFPVSKKMVRENMICAGETGKGICDGDSGGALACKVQGTWLQAGIASWSEGCGAPHRPSVFTRVTAFVDWINHHVH